MKVRSGVEVGLVIMVIYFGDWLITKFTPPQCNYAQERNGVTVVRSADCNLTDKQISGLFPDTTPSNH